MQHVFVSYSRRDVDIMQRVRDQLRANRIETWTDEQLDPGTRAWKLAIEDALDNAGAVVVVLSPDAKASEWVDREVEYARLHGIAVFPLLARGTPTEAVPLELVSSQWIDVREATEFDVGLKRLIIALQNHLGISQKTDAERVMDQLRSISRSVPTTYLTAITDINGFLISLYTLDETVQNHIGERDKIAALTSSALALSDRVTAEMGAARFHYSIMAAETGFLFFVLLNESLVLTLGVRELKSIDGTLMLLQNNWHELLSLLEIEAPKI